ncbi:WD domain, G-beta repeat-containing protein [Toxoplasma gondii GT1]|uniref:WD domain, G-beta repeat-containing protein n=5 Tax=Toxoplasma gondii TaxID=5811 RepID=S7UP51_TOXGG|nr:WD domain, G-beta repeat-containing protein [Toxoplasma gondii GT1]KAF4643689.1 WD domain, G-beta repeat-containing protein [Toxoplasma gondii]PUA86261.1 WD domain, G-beta repeat-containing protein [Toxoplasma gondii TgCATBr9]RQX69604.1 WD domain, G-beta repeat-containing protein [Toxoplasma gondii CAST]
MCRLTCVITSGQPLLLADILTRPRMGIIHQSFNCKERLPHRTIRQAYQQASLNGDGFGVGWYSSPSCLAHTAACYEEDSFDSHAYDCMRETSISANGDRATPAITDRNDPGERRRTQPLTSAAVGDAEPCVFTSLKPAWADRNLFILAEKIASRLIFAHVRAASTNLTGSCASAAAKAISAGEAESGGLPAWATCSSSVSTELCCHPFRCGRFLFMHNGGIGDFEKIRRPLLSLLPDPFFTYAITNSSIDSVCLFALFLSLLPHSPLEPSTPATMRNAVEQMINVTCCLLEKYKCTSITLLNVVVTDGACVVATKFVTRGCESPCERSCRGPEAVGSKQGEAETRRRHLPAGGARGPGSAKPKDEKLPAVYSQWYKAMLEATDACGEQEQTGEFEEDGCQAASLYFATGTCWQQQGEDPESFVMTHSDKRTDICIVTSEPLTANPDDWMAVPRNHLVLITPAIDLMLHPITVSLSMPPHFFFASSPSVSPWTPSPFAHVACNSPCGPLVPVNASGACMRVCPFPASSQYETHLETCFLKQEEPESVGDSPVPLFPCGVKPLCRVEAPRPVPACMLSHPQGLEKSAKSNASSLFATEHTDARASVVSSLPSPVQTPPPPVEGGLAFSPVPEQPQHAWPVVCASASRQVGGLRAACVNGVDREKTSTKPLAEAFAAREGDREMGASQGDRFGRFVVSAASRSDSKRTQRRPSSAVGALALDASPRPCESSDSFPDDCLPVCPQSSPPFCSPSSSSPSASSSSSSSSADTVGSTALQCGCSGIVPVARVDCVSAEEDLPAFFASPPAWYAGAPLSAAASSFRVLSSEEENLHGRRAFSPLSQSVSLPPFLSCPSPLVSLYAPGAFRSAAYFPLVHTLRVSRSAILSMTAVTVRFHLDTCSCACGESFSPLASEDATCLEPGAAPRAATSVERTQSSASRLTQARHTQQSRGLYLTCRLLIAGRQDGSITVVETPSACLSRRRCFQAHTGGVLSLSAFAVTAVVGPTNASRKCTSGRQRQPQDDGASAKHQREGMRRSCSGERPETEGGATETQRLPEKAEATAGPSSDSGYVCVCCRRLLPKIYLVSGSSDTSVALWDISSLLLSSAAAAAAAAVAAPVWTPAMGEEQKGRELRRDNTNHIEDAETELDANDLLALRIRLRPHQGDVLSVSGYPASAQSNELLEVDEGLGSREGRPRCRRRRPRTGGEEARGGASRHAVQRLLRERRALHALDSGAGCVYTYYHCSRCCDLWGRRPTRALRGGPDDAHRWTETARSQSFSSPFVAAPSKGASAASARMPSGLDVSPLFVSAFSAPALLFLGFQSTKVGVISIPSLLRYMAYVDAFLMVLDRLLCGSSSSGSGTSSAASSRSSSEVGRAAPHAESRDEMDLHRIRLRHEEEGKKIFALAAALLREAVLVDTQDRTVYPRKKPKRGARHPGHPCCFSGGVFACKAPETFDVFPLINASLQEELRRSLRRYRNLSLLESFAETRSFEECAARGRQESRSPAASTNPQENTGIQEAQRDEPEDANGVGSRGGQDLRRTTQDEATPPRSHCFSEAMALQGSAGPSLAGETAHGLLLARTLSETLSPQRACSLFALSKPAYCSERSAEEDAKAAGEPEPSNVSLSPLHALGCSLLSTRDLQLECRFLPFAPEPASACVPSPGLRDRTERGAGEEKEMLDHLSLYRGSSLSPLPGSSERGKGSPSTAYLSSPPSPISVTSRGGSGVWGSPGEPEVQGVFPSGDGIGDSCPSPEGGTARDPCTSPQDSGPSSPLLQGCRRVEVETGTSELTQTPGTELRLVSSCAAGSGLARIACMRGPSPASPTLRTLPGAADPPGHVGFVECVVPCGPYLCSGGGDGRVVVWNPRTGAVRGELRGHRGGVLCLSFYAEELQLGHNSAPPRRGRWARLRGRCGFKASPVEHPSCGGAYASLYAETEARAGRRSETVSPSLSEGTGAGRGDASPGCAEPDRSRSGSRREADGESEGLLFSGSRDKTIRVWRVDDMVCVHALLQHSAEVISLTSSSAHGLLVSGAANGEIFVWCVETLEVVYALSTACVGETRPPFLPPMFSQALGAAGEADGAAADDLRPASAARLARGGGQGVAVTALLLVGRTAAAEQCGARRRRSPGMVLSGVNPQRSGDDPRGEKDEAAAAEGRAPQTASSRSRNRESLGTLEATEAGEGHQRKETHFAARTEDGSSGDSSVESSSGQSSDDDEEANMLLEGDGTDTVQLWAATGNGLLRVWQVPSLKDRGRHFAVLAALTETSQPAGDAEAQAGAQKSRRERPERAGSPELSQAKEETERQHPPTEASLAVASRGPRVAAVSPTSRFSFRYLQDFPDASVAFGSPAVDRALVSSSSCFMNLLRRFVALRSVSGSPACVIPGWQAASFLASCFERLLGAEVQLLPTSPSASSSFSSSASACTRCSASERAAGDAGDGAPGVCGGGGVGPRRETGSCFLRCGPQSAAGETAGLPIVLARLGRDAGKPTVVFYSHYDVVGAESSGEEPDFRVLCGASPREGTHRQGPERHGLQPNGNSGGAGRESRGASGTKSEASERERDAQSVCFWRSNPWSVWGEDGYVYGRGVSDNKGPILCTLFAVRAFVRHHRRRRHLELKAERERREGTGTASRERTRRTQKGLPFNFVWISEGREESGSGGFEDALKKHLSWIVGNKFFVICTNSYWIDDVHPCLVYGMRGVVDARIVVKGGEERTGHHSGVHGGAVAEPLQELLHVVSSLTDAKSGRVRVPQFYDDILPLSNEEVSSLTQIPLDAATYGASVKRAGLRSRDGPTLLRKRWLEPCLSVVNISSSAQCLVDSAAAVFSSVPALPGCTDAPEHATHARCDHAHASRDSLAISGGGNFRIIPAAAFCDICIRLVPSQNPVTVFLALKRYVEALVRDMQSEHQVFVHLVGHGQGWKTNKQSESAKALFSAAQQAVQEIWGVEPLHILEGGSMPVIKLLTDLLIRHIALSRGSSASCPPRSCLRSPSFSSSSSSFAGLEKQRRASEKPDLSAGSLQGNEGQDTEGQTEEGGSFDDVVAIQIPLGQASDNAHLPNERIRVINLYRGVKVLERTLDLLAQLQRRILC